VLVIKNFALSQHPAGQDLAFVRKVRDDIKVRVEVLLSELLTNLA
jgi:hypothetical protein